MYVIDNPAAHGLSLDAVKAVFSSFYFANYAPIHILSYSIDYTFWGLNPFGYHLTNIALQAICGILFYRLLWLIYRRRDVCFIAALFFVVHPVQVESVAWISQRKNLLSMCFFLLAMICYLVYVNRDKKYYFLSLLFFTLALLSKSVVLILPVALLLMDFTILEKKPSLRIFKDKVPYFLLSAVSAVLTVISQGEGFNGGIISDYHGGSSYSTFLTMLTVFAEYLRMVIWPSRLSAVYAPPIRASFLDPAVLFSALLLMLLTVVSWLLYKKEKNAAFWLWFSLLAFVPVSQIIPITTMMNDRYLYYPMLGFSVLLGIAFVRITKGHGERFRFICSIALAAIFLVLSVAAHGRGRVWQDAYHLWSDAVAKTPGSGFAHQGLAEIQEKRGELVGAAMEYTVAISLLPYNAELYNKLGVVYVRMGLLSQAIDKFQHAIALKPLEPSFRTNLGSVYIESGEYKKAIPIYEGELKRFPGNLKALCALAVLYEKIGDRMLSSYYYNYSLRINPTDTPGLCKYISAMSNQGSASK